MITDLGGAVKFMPKLHAKIILVDKREAVVTSANFTTGGLDLNYEGGIWTCNPIVINEVCSFIDKLRYHAQE
jgi:phosphatidylserine/phosphatidylglycerophosphate/cardiolipin synthase-like enzyme